ncbi:MarR family transcriptional regulator [Aquamicrobium sp. LC103]|uniref:GbsR/MarR family transcriptional regulator n=1 Tax=Aquamicrobium sp. LC103 TaxID=1120658 RepID=UPI00069A4EFA|nr:MarR family transcriptional regulator [Aquamicrobium sp. LC103]TKT82498.1 MarR family transcriptional regulator [Aquamicrobium sp. LC103]
MSDDSDDPVTDFIEMMGVRFQEQNMPRIAGRLFGLILIEPGPLSFAELAERLQVSRGSVSTNARMLVDLGYIERIGKPGDRHDHYHLAPGGLASVFRKQVKRLRWADGFYRSIEARLPAHRHQSKQRLMEIATFTLKAAEALERSLAEAEELLTQAEKSDAS